MYNIVFFFACGRFVPIYYIASMRFECLAQQITLNYTYAMHFKRIDRERFKPECMYWKINWNKITSNTRSTLYFSDNLSCDSSSSCRCSTAEERLRNPQPYIQKVYNLMYTYTLDNISNTNWSKSYNSKINPNSIYHRIYKLCHPQTQILHFILLLQSYFRHSQSPLTSKQLQKTPTH